MKRVGIFVGSRANLSSIFSFLVEAQNSNEIVPIITLGCSAVSEKFGSIYPTLDKYGIKVHSKVPFLLADETPLNMAQTCGLGIINLSQTFASQALDCLVIIGDRFEVMSAAIAASYQNIPLLHTMGGEVTGTIDENIRHALTKLSNYHFASNEDSRQRIIKMGEPTENTFNVGCPRIDTIKKVLAESNSFEFLLGSELLNTGVGAEIDLSKPFLMMSFHPVTTEYEDNSVYVSEILKAMTSHDLQIIGLWPNADAGANNVAKAIRKMREKNPHVRYRFYKNLQLETYIHCMNLTKCLVGNSSSGLRDGAFIGTPVVNIGSRQNSRLSAGNVINCKPEHNAISNSIQIQLQHGKYDSDHLYGDGFAGKKMCEIIGRLGLKTIQKRITY
ncbi:UDP-N-acetylglucosamine 2-epimerase [Planktomarina temperata]|nr:UDP-N-acetylglucosamine 2-epimerase [Planktomarina temperata]